MDNELFKPGEVKEVPPTKELSSKVEVYRHLLPFYVKIANHKRHNNIDSDLFGRGFLTRILVNHLPSEAVFIDMGAGDMQKGKRVLEQVTTISGSREHHLLAVDISPVIMKVEVPKASAEGQKVYGLQAELKDALEIYQKINGFRVFMSFDSVLTNGTSSEVMSTLGKLVAIMRPGEALMLSQANSGMEDMERIERSYDFPCYYEFMWKIAEIRGFDPDDWSLKSRVQEEREEDSTDVYHEFFLCPKTKRVTSEQSLFKSYKQEEGKLTRMITETGLTEMTTVNKDGITCILAFKP